MGKYDLVLTGGRVVDPANGVDEVQDVAVDGGRIAKIDGRISGEKARRIIDLEGKVVFPGVIDSHVHVAGSPAGFRMTAAAGVTTLIDFGSRMENLCQSVKEGGVGQTVGGLFSINHAFDDVSAGFDEVEPLVERAIDEGSLGIKIVGGHYPLSSALTAEVIEEANRNRCYIAFHLGTAESGSHLRGVEEIPDLIGSNNLHVAHVNSYCRGMIEGPVVETQKALAILQDVKDQVVSESYLGTINGTSGRCEEGRPVSHVTRNCLQMEGYEPTRRGLEKAVLQGYCRVQVERGGVVEPVTGEEGVAVWEKAGTEVHVSFPVNSPAATFLCATEKTDDGSFVVDAISTDGGAIPRNVALVRGLALVRYGALTLAELARKVSWAPAKMFGLAGKGHLGEGADADITVVDLKTGEPYMAFSRGHLLMLQGVVVGEEDECRILTTERGTEAVQNLGLSPVPVDLEQSQLYS